MKSKFYYKKMKLLNYHLMVMFNNKTYIPKGITIEMLKNHHNWNFIGAFGTLHLEFWDRFNFETGTFEDHWLFENNLCPQITLESMLNSMERILYPYYQMRYKAIFHLIRNVYYNPDNYNKRTIHTEKINDQKYFLKWNNEEYNCWFDNNKYHLKSNKERLADLGGFISVLSNIYYQTA